jgi:hypothetical protein
MWNYNNTVFSKIEDFPKNSYGFVYRIENTITGKFYIGKKNLHSQKNVKLGKKEIALLPLTRGRKPTTKLVITESNWKEYYGSCKELQDDIKKLNKTNFKREILEICYSKKHLTYCEVKYQFLCDVLVVDNCYNDSIGGRYYKKDLIFS